MNSTDIKIATSINQIRSFAPGKQEFTRKELIDLEQAHGFRIHHQFWSKHRIGHGMFSVDSQAIKPEATESNVVKPQEPKKNVISGNFSFDRFDYNAMIPQKNPLYVEWGNSKVVNSLIASRKFFTLYVYGESGVGKNEMIDHACYKANRPIVRVSITRETKEDHLVGSKTLESDNIRYEDGPVKWAAKNGAVLLLDEISAGDPNELMCLHNILEGKPFFVKSANEMVTPHPAFCVIATDNTKGRGDDTGSFMGTNILNDAFLERFMMFMHQSFPTAKIEREIYKRVAEYLNYSNTDFTERLLNWVLATRKTYAAEVVNSQISVRRACQIIHNASLLGDEDLAIKLAINRFDETTMESMMQYWQATNSKVVVETDDANDKSI